MDTIVQEGGNATCIVGNFNARGREWDTTTNERGKAIIRRIRRTSYKVTCPGCPRFHSRDRKGSSCPDLVIRNVRGGAAVVLTGGLWEGALDHTPVLYENDECAITERGRPRRRRTEKTQLQCSNAIATSEAYYVRHIPQLLTEVQNATVQNAQQVYKRTTGTILAPWWTNRSDRWPSDRPSH